MSPCRGAFVPAGQWIPAVAGMTMKLNFQKNSRIKNPPDGGFFIVPWETGYSMLVSIIWP